MERAGVEIDCLLFRDDRSRSGEETWDFDGNNPSGAS